MKKQQDLNNFEKSYAKGQLDKIFNYIYTNNSVVIEGQEDNEKYLIKYLGIDFTDTPIEYYYRPPLYKQIERKSKVVVFYMTTMDSTIKVQMYEDAMYIGKDFDVDKIDDFAVWNTFKNLPKDNKTYSCTAVVFQVPYYKKESMKQFTKEYFNIIKKEW